jgi:Tfp pilus assembly protein PilF
MDESEGRLDEARARLEEALGWEPRNGQARVAMARFLLRRAENDRARDLLEQTLKDDPGDADARALLEKIKTE